MPTFLELKLTEFAAGLDNASLALLADIDGISALSILYELHQKADVNDRSAFVSTAVINSKNKGGAGQEELEATVACLSQDGTLDNNAQGVLRTASPQAALTGLCALLQMDPSNVRNPSAYVTRNVINCERDGGNANEGKGAQVRSQLLSSIMSSPAGLGADGSELIAKWLSRLDTTAQERLQQVGPMATQHILKEMDSKDAMGQVRNPSGYVSVACDNFMAGAGPRLAPPTVSAPTSQELCNLPDIMTPLAMLDAEALQALETVGPVKATPILEKLQAQIGQLRNPSAFVISAVANLSSNGEGFGTQTQRTTANLVCLSAKPQPREMTVASLDATAQAALQEVGYEAAEIILQELDSKGACIKDPSGYVARAMLHAHRVQGTEPSPATSAAAAASVTDVSSVTQAASLDSLGVTQGMQGMPPDLAFSQQATNSDDKAASVAGLDEKAVAALLEVGPDAAATIVGQLEQLGGKVHNPSAYVLRAANNAKSGKGAGGLAVAAVAHANNADMLEPWAQRLDSEAMSHLRTLMPDAAASVLQELESRWHEIKNPSAYVVRAVGNSKRGGLRGVAAPMGAGAAFGQAQPEPGQLDAHAMLALEEVGVDAATIILQNLLAQGPSVTNPSAWVIRAVGNEKRGVRSGSDGSDEHYAKKPRLW